MVLRVEKAYHELDEYYKQEDSKREEKEKIDL